MGTRMRWDKRRPVFRPWYDRDLNPFEREATNFARHGVLPSPKQAKPAKPKLPPIRTPLERPTVAGGALAPKYALRTGDLAKAREALSGAVEAVVYCDGSAAPKNPGIVGAGAVILAGGVRVELYGGGPQRRIWPCSLVIPPDVGGADTPKEASEIPPNFGGQISQEGKRNGRAYLSSTVLEARRAAQIREQRSFERMRGEDALAEGPAKPHPSTEG